MIAGKFILRNEKGRKPNAFGEYVINLQYCTQGVAVKKSTDIWVSPEHWLGDNGRSEKFVKGGKDGNAKAAVFNARLANIKRKYDEVINSLLVEKTDVIPVPVLRSILNDTYFEKKEEENGKVPFVEFALNATRERYNIGQVSINVWENTKSYMRKFEKFLCTMKHKNTDDKNILYCRDVDEQLVKDYIIWRKNEGNKNGTINHALTPIFTAVKDCCSRGWIDRYVCEKICNLYLPADAKSLDEDTTIKSLTLDQIRKLKEAAQSSRKGRCREYLDMFIFAVCTSLRVGNLMTLRWQNIDMEKRMIVNLLQVKGHGKRGTLLNIPLNDVAVKILESWKGRYDNFVFGLLDSDFDLSDDEEFFRVKSSATRSINQSLQILGEKTGLPFTLSIHKARHSFAMVGLNNGIDIKTISSIMGHSSILTTEKVYASLLPDTLTERVGDKLNFDL